MPQRWPLFKIFSKPHTKHHFKQLEKQSKWSKQVTKSPWISMDEKGACTFPFHNLPPEPKKTSQRSFLCFLTFPLDKIKSQWRLLLNRNICKHKRKTSSQFSHRITELATLLGKIIKWGYLRARSHLFAYICLTCLLYIMILCLGLNPLPGFGKHYR